MSRDFVKIKREHIHLTLDDIDNIFHRSELLIKASKNGPLLAFLMEIGNPYFKWVNERVIKVLGWEKEEILEKSFFEFVHPEDLEITKKVFEDDIVLDRDDWVFQNRYRTKDGNYETLVWASTTQNFGNYIIALALPLGALKDFEKEWKQK